MPRYAKFTLLLLMGVAHAQVPEPELAKPDLVKPAALKTVEIEWEAVDTASSYDVRLTPATGEAALIFSSSESRLSQALPLGTYSLQIRAHDKDGETLSAWGDPSKLEVAIKEITPLFPEDGATIKAHANKQTVEFQWTPVDEIKKYSLKVWSESRKETPWLFTGQATSKKLEVPAGEVYHWQVSFESANEVDYQQEPKTFSFTLQGTKLVRPEILPVVSGLEVKSIAWKPVAEANEYLATLAFHYLDEEEWRPLKTERIAGVTWTTGKLRPGRYKVLLTARAPRRLNSDPAEYEFTVKPSAPELATALSTAVGGR